MMTTKDSPEIGRLISSKDHDYPFYFNGQHFISLGDNPIIVDSIRSDGDFYTEPTYHRIAFEKGKIEEFNDGIEAAKQYISNILEHANWMDDYRDGLEKLKKVSN